MSNIDEIKEILKDNDELLVNYKDGSFQSFDTLPKNVLDYITNLQEENESLKQQLDFIEEQNKYIDKLEKLLREKDLYKYTPEKGFRLVGDDNE